MTRGLSELEQAWCEHFGHRPVRASLTLVGVEAIEVLRFTSTPSQWAYLTLGMSRQPMTGADAAIVASDGPRAELELQVLASPGRYTDLWRQLAVLAAAPAVEGLVYAEGVSVDLGVPLSSGSSCTGAVVAGRQLPSVTTATGTVDVFRLAPALGVELAWARVHGSAALRDRWAQQGVDLTDLGRQAALLQ